MCSILCYEGKDIDKNGKFIPYEQIEQVHGYFHEDLDTITTKIHDKLIRAVEKRLEARVLMNYGDSGV